jgi:hypothetical protein
MRVSHRRGPAGARRALLAVVAAAVTAATGCSASTPAATHPAAAHSATPPPVPASPAARPFLAGLHTVRRIARTVPANGDVNPYGITVVPQTTGHLVKGDTLVSNFNAKANVQGTGTTVVQIAPDGTVAPFAQLGRLPSGLSCPGGIGLTTALNVLPGGWVVVGSLPTGPDGALPALRTIGCLIVLNSRGIPVETWVSPNLDGPWDMTMAATPGHAALFVSDVLSPSPDGGPAPEMSGLCNVVRVNLRLVPGAMPKMTGVTVIGAGFPWRQDQAALVQGPAGLALSRAGTLYVVSTISNAVLAIPGAATRTSAASAGSRVLTRGGALNGPLGLTLAPDGDLIAVNGNNGNAVEITPSGQQTATVRLVRRGAGALFGVTPQAGGHGLLFVNDGTNALDLLSS